MYRIGLIEISGTTEGKMRKNIARLSAGVLFLVAGSAGATSSLEDSGLSLAGGYAQAKLTGFGTSFTPSGTDFLARATYAIKHGAFAKAEYERADTSGKLLGAKASASIEETRIGLGYAFPVTPNLKLYPAADYVLNRNHGDRGGTALHGADHGYFVGGGASAQLPDLNLYFRGGYYHIQGYGVTTTGPDLLLGIGTDISSEAAIFAETRYAPISGGGLDTKYLAIRAGVKLKF